jgi:hypothetical protein
MDIQFKVKRREPIDDRIAIPVSSDLRAKVEGLKRNYHIDINEMVRMFLDQTVKKVESGEFQPHSY